MKKILLSLLVLTALFTGIARATYVPDSVSSYAEMYQNDNGTVTTINTINVWEEVDNFSAGDINGWIVTGKRKSP
jgi:hypothetical protein